MQLLSKITERIRSLKRFFVFYRKPEYLRMIRKWLTVRPEDIPAVETSDAGELCRNPLVSVCMITYNQEKWIGQAIESVLAQKTDFEYEILIGDDCSTDKTGAICAEYQRRNPDKIRFITADRNVSKLGGNGNRLLFRARGEFIAHLEGDDYWTDSNKLQKQIDVFRRHPEVTLCLSKYETLHLDGTITCVRNAHFDEMLAKSPEQDGTLFDSDDYFAHPLGGPIGTAMYRKADIDFDELCTFYYRTSFTYYFLLLKKGRGFLLKKPMTMYRVNPNGVWSGKNAMEQARFSYEYYGQLLLHVPENNAIKSIQRHWWRKFRCHLFPWSICLAFKRRLRQMFAFALGCASVLAIISMHKNPDVRDRVNAVHEIIAQRYLSPDGLMYAYEGELPDRDDCERGFPNALGYWTVIENTPMFTGSYLSGMVSRAERLGDYESAEECRRLAMGLVKIASVSDVPGMIVRGFGKDGRSHYSSTTTCQYIPWFIGLHAYATSRICPNCDRVRIRDVMARIANGLLEHGWRCPCDGPLKGCYFGAINSKGMPHRDSAHYLFVLAAMYDVTGDASWQQLYEDAKKEFCEKSNCTRLEACSKGWGEDKPVYNPENDGNMWIYVCTQECLAELARLECDRKARDQYKAGMKRNAESARPFMKLAKRYDNCKVPFDYANWRKGYRWEPQTNTVQALSVSKTGDAKILGGRKWYERNFVSQPLCAATVCAYAGMYPKEIAETINCYDFETINISEFFFAEIAYWKFLGKEVLR